MELIYITPELWQTSEIEKLTKAFVKFTIAFDNANLKKDCKNPFLKNSYVSLDNILNTIRPLLSANGLVITQDLAGGFITTQLMHESGQFKGSGMHFLPMKVNSGTNALQAMGGGITYAKRYAIAALLGLSVDNDDDGNGTKDKDIAPPKKKAYPVKSYEKAAKSIYEGKCTIMDIEEKFKLSDNAKKVIKGMVLGLADKETENELNNPATDKDKTHKNYNDRI